MLSAPVLATYVAATGVYPYGRTITKVSDAVQRARLAVAGGTVVQAAFNNVCLAHLLDNSTLFIGSTRVENLRNISESATTNSILFGCFDAKTVLESRAPRY